MWNYDKAPADVVAKARALTGVAERFSVPLAAAALQFPLRDDIVSAVIPGPRDKNELAQILEWFSVPIPSEFWAMLLSEGLVDERARI